MLAYPVTIVSIQGSYPYCPQSAFLDCIDIVLSQCTIVFL